MESAWYFREALVKYLEVGRGGVRGIVRDVNGQGVQGANVILEDIDKNIVTSPRGEYWRILAPGIYRYMYFIKSLL